MVIYQRLPRMEFIFHNSYATLELAVCIQTVYNVIVFWVLNNYQGFSSESSHLIFHKYINTLLKSILSVAYICRKMVFD